MRILYFHQHFSTPSGSAGTRSYEFSQRLVAAGHDVTVVCGSYAGGSTGLSGSYSRGRRTGVVEGIHVIELELKYSNRDNFLKRTWTFLRFAIRSIWIALTAKYDLIFATTTPLTAGIPGIFAKWLRGKRFVFEVRDLWPELPKAMGVIRNPFVLWAMAILEWMSYRSAHRVIGLSPGIVDGIASRGVRRDRITMIPNGCDLDLFGQPKDVWRPQGVAEEDLLAIFAGTHGIANGLNAILDAAAELQRRGETRVKLVLVGEGKLKTSLQERAVREQLDSVIFLEPVNKKKLSGLMAGADLGMQILSNVPAFYYGTSPNKFFDYLAAGLPVLVNYPGWVAELIVEHQCGFAIPGNDPVAFADALQRALQQRTALPAMGRNARALAESQFSRDQLAAQFIAWLEGATDLRETNQEPQAV